MSAALGVASDSHITNPHDGTFSSVDKISVVRFWIDEVLVAQAGLWSATNRVVMHMRKNAIGKRITSEHDVLKVIEDSIRETKSPLDEKQKEFLSENGAALMIAFYVGKSPYIYHANVCAGSSGIRRKPVACCIHNYKLAASVMICLLQPLECMRTQFSMMGAMFQKPLD